MADDERFTQATRRDFLKMVGGGAAGSVLAGGMAYAHHHPRPSPQSMPYLDQQTYINNMEVIAHVPGRRGSNPRMMSIGSQRLMFMGPDVIDVTDAKNPTIINAGGARGGELAYASHLKKWIVLSSAAAPTPSEPPGGKYEDATTTKMIREFKGLRGIRLWDATDPTKITQLSEYSTGQTGAGVHGDSNYWDGGRYAYLGGAPDDTFTHQVAQSLFYSNCLMIVDVLDPANVKPVANWWVPGQRNNEVEEFKKWRVVQGRVPATLESTKTIEEATKSFKSLRFPFQDRTPRTWFHGPMYVPIRVEDGGTRGYGAWSSFGFLIHDVSNIKSLKLVGRFETPPAYGSLEGIPFHNIWLGTLDRGFVVGNPESMNPDCNEVYQPTWVIDVRDETNPTPIGMLPRPRPAPEAPYTDFCFARGRFGPHSCPPLAAPGRMSNTFLPIAFFNAGVQCFDLTEPSNPKIVASFVPPHAGTLSPECRTPLDGDTKMIQKCLDESNSFNRPTDNCFVEWDRKLIYACTTAGMYILSTPALGKPILGALPVTEWAAPGVNKGLTA